MAEYSIQKAGDKNRKGQCYYLSKSRREERRILDPGHWLRGYRVYNKLAALLQD